MQFFLFKATRTNGESFFFHAESLVSAAQFATIGEEPGTIARVEQLSF